MHSALKLQLAVSLGLCLSGPVLAADPETSGDSAFSIKGFGTLALDRSDNGQVGYVRDLSQPSGVSDGWDGRIDDVLGLQAEYRINDHLEGMLQAISRYRYDGSYDPEISWAFLRYDPGPNLSLRLGRLGTEFYMQSDSKWVGYANTTVRPAPDFYDSLIFTYFDGADVSVTCPAGDNLFRAKLFAGVSPEKSPFVPPITWNLSGSPIVGGYLEYLAGPWQFRLSRASIRFKHELPFDRLVEAEFGLPGFLEQVPSMKAADKWGVYTSVGAAYDQGPLQLQVMLGRIDNQSSTYEDSRTGYVVAGYRLGEFTPYAGYSWVKSKPGKLSPAPFPYDVVAAQLLAQTHSDQHTTTLGVRWDVHPNMDLKFQVDRIHATPDSLWPYRESSGTASWDGKATIYSIALDFVF